MLNINFIVKYLKSFELFESESFVKEIKRVLNAVGVKYAVKDLKDYYEVKFDASNDSDQKKYDKYSKAAELLNDFLGDNTGEIYSEESGHIKIYKK